MAGTDRTRAQPEALDATAPAIILVEPQLGENIGTAARAMLNCGLTDLRLVRPRDKWPNEKAVGAASGADFVLAHARLYDKTEDAIADLHHVFCTTARRRDMLKPVLTPREAAKQLRALAPGERSGVIFGGERWGLHNDDVILAQKIIEVPMNPAFSSLNLAQAVLIVGYEWRMAADATPAQRIYDDGYTPASAEDMRRLFEHLETELDAVGYLWPPEKRPTMVRNIRNIFQRAALTEQEVRTLRGMIKDLVVKNRRKP